MLAWFCSNRAAHQSIKCGCTQCLSCLHEVERPRLQQPSDASVARIRARTVEVWHMQAAAKETITPDAVIVMQAKPFTPTKPLWRKSFQTTHPEIKSPSVDTIGRMLHKAGHDPDSFRDYLDNGDDEVQQFGAMLLSRDVPSFWKLFITGQHAELLAAYRLQQQQEQQLQEQQQRPQQPVTASPAPLGSGLGTPSHPVNTAPGSSPGVVLPGSRAGGDQSTGPRHSVSPSGRPDQLRGVDGCAPIASTVAPPPQISNEEKKSVKKQMKAARNKDLCVEPDWDPAKGTNWPAVLQHFSRKGFTTVAQAEVTLWMAESETVSSVSGTRYHSLKLLDKEGQTKTYTRIYRESTPDFPSKSRIVSS